MVVPTSAVVLSAVVASGSKPARDVGPAVNAPIPKRHALATPMTLKKVLKTQAL